jgi:Co/Zn/Cd efflux system component
MAKRMEPHRSPLDDSRNADFAWARYRRLMAFMSGVTLAVVLVCLVLLHRSDSLVSPHFYIATGLGIGAAMMLTAALMGLVFLSSGTGHDESIVDPLENERI